MMSSPSIVIEREITIHADPAAVEGALADRSLISQIYPRISLLRIDEAWPEPGSAMIALYRIIGMTFELSLSILEHTPLSHVKAVIVRNGQCPTPIAGRIVFEWSGKGAATRLVCLCEYDVPEDPLTQDLERWVMRSINTDNVEASLSNLKRLLETGRI